MPTILVNDVILIASASEPSIYLPFLPPFLTVLFCLFCGCSDLLREQQSRHYSFWFHVGQSWYPDHFWDRNVLGPVVIRKDCGHLMK